MTEKLYRIKPLVWSVGPDGTQRAYSPTGAVAFSVSKQPGSDIPYGGTKTCIHNYLEKNCLICNPQPRKEGDAEVKTPIGDRNTTQLTPASEESHPQAGEAKKVCPWYADNSQPCTCLPHKQTDLKREDLLRCPFCGFRPVYDLDEREDNVPWVACVNADCPAQPSVQEQTSAGARCAWNTRT